MPGQIIAYSAVVLGFMTRPGMLAT